MMPGADAATTLEPIRVLVADDEAPVRGVLAACLRSDPRFAVAGLAASAYEATQIARRSRPDVALIDVEMPGGGVDAVRGIRANSPTTHIVALAGSNDRKTVIDMLGAGAASYLVKSVPAREIADSLLRAARGESILSARIPAGLLGEAANQLKQDDLERARRRRLRRPIEQALHGGAFHPVFQPIIALETGAVAGYEALSRFSAGPHAPESWFADARRAGLAAELELAAARAALSQFGGAGRPGFLSVNVSPTTLSRCVPLCAQFHAVDLVLEVTEHAGIDDYEAIRHTLARLREHGVRLAVDDAGSGYASLRHALELGPAFIKLDISLTRDIGRDRGRRALARALIEFAREVDAVVIAEGIETAAELDTLRSLRVPLGQGFHLGRPSPLPTSRVHADLDEIAAIAELRRRESAR